MSEEHPQGIDHQSDDSGFYNEKKSQQSEQRQQRKGNQNKQSQQDAFKSEKHKKIRKRDRRHGKPKTSKQEQRQKKRNQEAQQQADLIIDQMEKRFEDDKKLYQNKKPANKKLSYLPILSKKLKNVLVWQKFIQSNGLQQFQNWFSRLQPQGIQPSLTLRKGLLQILDCLKIKSQYIVKTKNEIHRIVQKHKKSQTKQLRQLSQRILLKWSIAQHQEQIE